MQNDIYNNKEDKKGNIITNKKKRNDYPRFLEKGKKYYRKKSEHHPQKNFKNFQKKNHQNITPPFFFEKLQGGPLQFYIKTFEVATLRKSKSYYNPPS